MAEPVTRARHSAVGLAIDAVDMAIVDDDPSMRDFLRVVCGSMGVRQIRTYSSAPEAFRAMRADPPDLVFVDWMMKPVDGLALVRRMRRVDCGPLCLVPVIMISAQATLAFVNRALSAGVHQVLAKPMLPTAVSSRISMLLSDTRPFILQRNHYCIEGAPEFLAAKSTSTLSGAGDSLNATDVWEI